MADQIKELLEKINQEGVLAAEQKARQIELQAQQQAEALVQKASAQAKKIVADAREQAAALEAGARSALQQAARDMVLTLRQDILALLQRLISADIKAALSADELSKIISGLIKDYCAAHSTGVLITLNEQDKNRLEGHVLTKLQAELKKGVELRSQESIRAGFIISFDAGKSHFDFTDQALADYIGSSLKPKIAQLLKGI